MDLQSLLPKDTEGMVHLGIVLTLGGIACGSAIGVVAFSNAVRSALCLVLNFFTLAFIYFSLSAEMLGITQIIVYTGAIMVLFLFVIMLLNLGGDKQIINTKDAKPPLGIMAGFALFALISSQLLVPMLAVNSMREHADGVPPTLNWGSPQAVGLALFSGYAWPFEVISLLLMVGIVGAILLARRKAPV